MNPITERRLAAIHRHLCSGPNFAPAASPLGLQDVCGIIAYIGQEPAAKFLHEGLSILQNRGYDSAGISTVNPKGELVTTKFASVGTTSDAIDKLAETLHYHESNTIGIAHTRWATHGAKTDKNAHPHHDQSDRIALVHNGVIENSNDLREELQKKGIKFRSETDTEVIVQLIGYHLQESNDLVGAVKQALSRLEGTWGIVVLDRKNPNELLAAKNGSPLLVGQGQGKMFVASEASAFSRHTKEYISLENGEVIVVRIDGHSLDQSRVELAPTEKIRLNPDPFPHWTLKEILEQPEAISRSLNYGGRLIDESTVKLGGLEEQRESLKGIKNLIISACGTSLHAAHFGAGLMRSLQCFETVQVVDAAEMGREYFSQEKCGMLVLSQSGETKDVHRALTIAEELNIPVFSVVNVVGSLIARTTRCGVYLNAGREMAVASTKAFTCQVAVLALITAWFSQIHDGPQAREDQKRRNMIDALHRLSTNLGMTIHKLRKQCMSVAAKLENSQHGFILGKGLSQAIAMEGALKIKEISYMHAEGYSGGALKHGPFALIDKDERTPVILIVLEDIHFQFMCTAAAEVKARGAYVIVITNSPKITEKVADDIILIPSNGILTALLAVVPLQLIAYELAVRRKINPDKPRNLAKAVTVD